MLVRDFCSSNVAPSEAQLYGVEVELEDWDGTNPYMEEVGGSTWLWSMTEDGSLRNGGVEFLSNKPWNFSTCIEQYRIMCRAMADRGWSASTRTSVHVHVNCLDRTEVELGGILATYLAVEPVLFLLCGPEREENIYCVPWYRAPADAVRARSLIYGQHWPSVLDSCKYSALYLEPLRRFGTLEFRHAPTYTSAEDFENWLTAVQSVVGYGQQRTVEGVLEDLYRGSLNLMVERIFGAELANHMRGSLVRDPSFEALCDRHDTVGVVEMLLESPPCTYNPVGVEDWPEVTAEDEPQPEPSADSVTLSRDPIIFDWGNGPRLAPTEWASIFIDDTDTE